MVALRVQNGTTNTLYYPLTDHLGNVAALSDADGNLVSGSVAHYDPFGAFAPTAPTTNPAVTNHGFTGHRHNNTGSNDLGLIYMNARYYLPEAGRFISPDSIVPDPGNPQSFNRYVYTLNNPVNYADPSGHCPGTDGNSEDQACWDYLMGRGEANFCANGICGDGDWTQWLVAQKGMYTGTWSFSTPWTKTELEILSSTIGDVIGALESIGVDWHNTPLPQFKYKRAGSSLDGGMTLGRTISLGSVSPYLVLHETGHAIDAGFGKELHDWYDQEVGNCSILFCNPYAAPGSYYREYGHTAFHNKLGSAYGVAARQGETWADAFAAWVDQPEAQLQAEINLAIDWQGISDAVVSSLEHRFR
jgi:RHS repeat-associated protein